MCVLMSTCSSQAFDPVMLLLQSRVLILLLEFCRNCQGSKCRMSMTPNRPECALEALSVQLNTGNSSDTATCGLPEEDYFLLTPTDFTPGAHSQSARECIYGLPAGINLTIWFPCEKGKLSHVMELTFEEEPAISFTCEANPTCEETAYLSNIVCYAAGTDLVGNGAIFSSNYCLSVYFVWIIFIAWLYQF